MNKNRLLRRQGWRSGQKTANSILIKARKRKAGDRVVKVVWIIWGDLGAARAQVRAEAFVRRPDPRREVSSARSSDEGVETLWSEGANGAAACSRVKGDGQVTSA
jgi:hypothetical protein